MHNTKIAALLILMAVSFHHDQDKISQYHLQRESVGNPKKSITPWKSLWLYGDDHSFYLMLKMYRKEFNELLLLFQPKWEKNRNKQQLSHRMLDTEGALGLAILYLTCSSDLKQYCFFFGLTQPQLSKWLWKSLEVLNSILPKIEMCSSDKLQEYTDAIAKLHPEISHLHVCGFVDGIRVRIQRPKNNKKQRLYFNGWKKNHSVNIVM